MKGKMARTLVAEEANCKHSSKKSRLQGWALRCNLLQMNTRSLQEGAEDKLKKLSTGIFNNISSNSKSVQIKKQHITNSSQIHKEQLASNLAIQKVAAPMDDNDSYHI